MKTGLIGRLGLCLMAAACILAVNNVVAQEKKAAGAPQFRKMQFNTDDAVMIRELGALITVEKKSLVVKFIPPKDRRPKETAGEDIEANDEVGMANGKRVGSIKELRTLYDDAAVGSEFKLGVRRNGQLSIVTFTKKDPKEQMPGMTVVTGNPDNILPAMGIALEQRGSSVVIGKTLPNVPEGLKEGDVIESINGKQVTKVEEFIKEFDATKVGEKLEFGMKREGKAVTFATKRPEPKAQMMFRNE